MSTRPLSTKKILRKTEMWVLDSYFEKGLSSGSYKQGSYVKNVCFIGFSIHAFLELMVHSELLYNI